ncbi:hypothetical protein RB16p173 [Escherichia phage RB16]|uniref:Conserved hypothetical phage protein n=1 Tax=Escherichia phage RB16 TaxID=2681599 RepID=D9ICN4_BPRB1|nr:hypothetical protein RB16p173 [Escherichia phage RB16]ADJ55477.1 conserved hypothetical phage protein [Escherichia phage RB16]
MTSTAIQQNNHDVQLAQLIKEHNAFAASRVNEESEHTRRNLWTAIYREVFTERSNNKHTQAVDAADKALAAYDRKFGAQ